MRIRFGARCAVVFSCVLMAANVHATARNAATERLRELADRIDEATRETVAAHADGRAPARASVAAATMAKRELDGLDRSAMRSDSADDVAFARKRRQLHHLLANLERAQATSSDVALPTLIAAVDPRRTVHALPGAAGSTCATALSIAPGDAIETVLADAGRPGSALWVRFAASEARFLRLDTLATPLDTEIALFGAACPAGENDAVARNDDALGLAAALGIDTERHPGPRYARIANLGRAGRAIARLETEGAFVGRITDERDHRPLGAEVDAVTPDNFFGPGTYSDSETGLYVLSIDPGSYYLYVSGPGQYVAELYPDAACPNRWFGSCAFESATELTLADGQQIAGLDVALNIGGRIAGVVRDATTGAPIADGLVYAVADDGTSSTWGANTDATGRFTITQLLTGTYRLQAAGPGHGSQVFDHIACGGPVENVCDLSQGAPISVVRDQLVSGITFDLPQEAHIRATMTSRDGAPLPPWWSVVLYDANGNYYEQFGQSDGTQQTIDSGPIAPGTYLAAASAYGYFGQLWNGIDCTVDCQSTVLLGTPITVARGAVADIAFSLEALPRISGTVSDDATHAPVANVTVALVSTDSSSVEGYAYTDDSGRYTFSTAPPGTYWVYASGGLYRPTLYPDAPCSSTSFFSCDTSTATPVTTALGGPDRTGIDIAMPADGTISGRVLMRVPDGMSLAQTPAAYENILVYDASGAQVAYASTSPDGSYVAVGIPGGTFHVATSGNGFSQAWNGVDCAALCDPLAGAPIALAQGQQLGGIDFDPIPRAMIFGRVTIEGAPLAGAAIDLWDGDDFTHCGASLTNADGYYAITQNVAGCAFHHRLSTDVPAPLVNQVFDGIACPNGSAYLGLCSLAGGTDVAFPATPSFTIADFALQGPRDAIFASGFER